MLLFIIISVAVSVDVAVYVAVDVDIDDDITSDVHCFHCSNSDVNIFCAVITANIITYFSGTGVNITKYVIILISVFISVGSGGGGGWYIWGYLKDVKSCAIIVVSPVNNTRGKGGS